MAVLKTQTFTRPADTTAYAPGDLVANSTTAGSVTAMSFNFGNLNGSLRVAIIETSQAGATGSFNIWIFSADPSGAVTNGDNGALAGLSFATYPVVGIIPIDLDNSMSGVGARGIALYDANLIELGNGTYYALLEAASAYTPASGQTFTIKLGLCP